VGGCQAAQAGTSREIRVIDAELRSVVALRRAARERGGPLPSIDVADALLDERLQADRRASPLTPRMIRAQLGNGPGASFPNDRAASDRLGKQND
jgi:hypothetical protein